MIEKMHENIKTEKNKLLKDYQEFILGRGVYDKRNHLNDKTGKEWRFTTKSVIPYDFEETIFSPTLTNGTHVIPPVLAKNLIETFTKGNATVLDPFAAFGSFLVGASLARTNCSSKAPRKSRIATGIGQSVNMKKIYTNHCKNEPEVIIQDYFVGTIEEFTQKNPEREFDLIISEIPTVKEQGTEELAMEYFRHKEDKFDFDAWSEMLGGKLRAIWSYLKKNRYMVLVVPLDWFWHSIGKDQPYYYDLAYAVMKAAESSGAILKSEISWFKEVNSGKFLVELTKKILVFRKEED